MHIKGLAVNANPFCIGFYHVITKPRQSLNHVIFLSTTNMIKRHYKKKEGNLLINPEIRALSRRQLNGNWKNPILVGLSIIAIQIVLIILQAILPSVLSPIVALAVFVGVEPPIILGIIMYYLNFIRSNNPSPSEVTKGFEYWGKSVVGILLVGLYTWLWSLLLVIPGIVKSFSYSMTFYILSDHPEMTVSEAINESIKMMYGHKMQLFMLSLSFLGWSILASLTLGIGYIWLIPYMATSMANFYDSLR